MQGDLPSVGSISDELGNFLNKISEANKIAKGSDVVFELGFQAKDNFSVKVIRANKYQTYWDQLYFLDMLEIFLNEGLVSYIAFFFIF